MIPKKCTVTETEEILSAIPGCRFTADASWQKYSSMGAGTASFMLLELSTLSQLTTQIVYAAENHWTLFPIGGGTNLIGSDKELSTTCFIKLTGSTEFAMLEQDPDDPGIFICGPANSLAKTAVKALELGYGGLAELSGIPGTLGGAFKMNAGAMGKSLSDFIVDFTVMDLQTGQCFIRSKSDLSWTYRDSGLPDSQILLQLRMRLQKVNPETERAALDRERIRRANAPKGRSAGSVFRNPAPDNPAGRILDQLAVKGLSSGSFAVAAEHANWIVNRQNGPAPNREQDLLLLIRQLMDLTWEKQQILLRPEVKFVNPNTQTVIKKLL